MIDNKTKGLLLGLLAVSAFGLTEPITRLITPFFDPIFIGLGRAFLAALLALALLSKSKQPLPTLKQLPQLLIISLGIVVGFPVLSAWSMQSLHASHGGVVLGLLPLLTAAVAAIFPMSGLPYNFG